MDRRTFLLSASALAMPHVARAETPLKIGILNDQNGVFADYQGLGSVLAGQMALTDFRPARPVEIIAADHQNKPDVGMAIVRRWLDQEGVHIVMDVPNSAIALAVAQFVAERNRVFIGCGAGIADLTGSKCTANTVHWDYDTWEVSHALGRAITERGGKTWFTIAADYSFGADLDRNVTAAVQQAGGRENPGWGQSAVPHQRFQRLFASGPGVGRAGSGAEQCRGRHHDVLETSRRVRPYAIHAGLWPHL